MTIEELPDTSIDDQGMGRALTCEAQLKKRRKDTLQTAKHQRQMRAEPMKNKEFWELLDANVEDTDIYQSPSPSVYDTFRQSVAVP